MIKWSEVDESIKQTLRDRGISDDQANLLTPEEAFHEWCQYEGLIDCAPQLIRVLDNLREANRSEKIKHLREHIDTRLNDLEQLVANYENFPQIFMLDQRAKMQRLVCRAVELLDQ